jgi:DNA-binding CsgD family transcriptional regulator
LNNSGNVVFLHAGEIDFAKLIADAKTEFELFGVCDRICSVFALPFFNILRLPGETEQHLAPFGLVSNWPAFLISEYDENRLLENSPVIGHFRQSTEPLVLTLAMINQRRPDGKENVAGQLFEKHGLHTNVFFSVHLPNGEIGVVGFSGEGPEPDQTKLVELHYLSNLLFSKIHVLRDESEVKNFGLKPREIDCLQWTSQGKTSDEIATILSLSQHTVNHYLTNAARKLDTTNRTHAVSKALRLKIIS